MKSNRGIRKEKVGKVIKNSSNKSIIVKIDRSIKHPAYEKFMKKTTKFMVHDQKNACKVGDMVRITETRPISKRKKWRILKIIKNLIS